jgi:hypothetical protein
MFESQATPLNAFGSFSQGYQMVDESINRQQQIAMKQQQLAQEQATQQQELAQKQAILTIGQEAARTGDPRTLAMLSVVNPDGAKSIRETLQYFTDKTIGDLQSIIGTPISDRQATYQTKLDEIRKSNPYFDTSKYPTQYSTEVDAMIKADLISNGDKKRQYSVIETDQGLMAFEQNTGQISRTGLGVYNQPPSTVVNVGGEQPAFRKEFEKTYGRNLAIRMDAIQTTAENASETKQYLQLQKEALANLPNTGVLDSSKIFLGSLANEVGVNVDMGKISSLEQLSAAGNTITIPLVKKLGYNPTDADARLIGSTIANIGKGKSTNEQLINLLDQAANKQIEKANIVDRLRSQKKEEDIPKEIRKYDANNPIKLIPQKKSQQSSGVIKFLGFE